MALNIKIGEKDVGDGKPVYIIAEIGINHNGDMQVVKRLIDAAVKSGCDAVKFQKRTPAICVPDDQKDIMRETPWGVMTYLDYRYKVELDEDDYKTIDEYCNKKNIHWFVSCWDEEAVDFINFFNPVAYKIASASLTDSKLLKKHNELDVPVILSTGMSTMDEIEKAAKLIDEDKLLLAHSTSSYPCESNQLNLRMITTLKNKYKNIIGYSGHEKGLQTTLAAVALGASFIERHITLDRSMWGSDQAASLEPQGLEKLVRDIRVMEDAFGDGIKKVYESELQIKKKLRRVL
tara:strand:- start:14280 stop:15152 length:873 start_codon:yes stop_codon:yes gene_type:complete